MNLDEKMLGIYAKYRGDEDGFSRVASRDEKEAMRGIDWQTISELLQGAAIVENGKASPEFAAEVDTRIRALCVNEDCLKKVREMAARRTITATERIRQSLNAWASLLGATGWPDKAEWFRVSAAKLDRLPAGSRDLLDFLANVYHLLSGMGSFTDLPMMPEASGQLTRESATKMQWELAEQLGAAIQTYFEENGAKMPPRPSFRRTGDATPRINSDKPNRPQSTKTRKRRE